MTSSDAPTGGDAPNLYDASFNQPTLIECDCKLDARRYFVKALDGGVPDAAKLVHLGGPWCELLIVGEDTRPPADVPTARR